ncbi:MAG: hypothetical protein HZB17_16945 [Chloroflexi bacterium]|nr:hypothetical protein [Chloroflexota bacterium]
MYPNISIELIRQVDTLSIDQQLRLAIYLLEKARVTVRPRQKKTALRAFGLLANSSPAPSDSQTQHWLNERRTEKYG